MITHGFPPTATLEHGRYNAMYTVWAPFRFVAYDKRIRERALEMTALATTAARKELKSVLGQAAGEERTARLRALLARVRGMPVEADVRKQLG